jgi:hypothetical protein
MKTLLKKIIILGFFQPQLMLPGNRGGLTRRRGGTSKRVPRRYSLSVVNVIIIAVLFHFCYLHNQGILPMNSRSIQGSCHVFSGLAA